MESDSYRYGFQGSEKDDEIKGSGNSYTTHFRQLDPRVGRWLSIDPKQTAWESPYVSMSNNPIMYNDPHGDTIRYGTQEGTVEASQILKGRVEQMRKKSTAFDVLVSQLEAYEGTIDLIVNDEFMNEVYGSSARGMNTVLPDQKGKDQTVFIRSTAPNETISEELFHTFQRYTYEVFINEEALQASSTEDLESISPLQRTFPEIEAEANLFQVLVAAESNESIMSLRGAISDLTEEKVFNALKANGYVVTPGTEIEDIYYNYSSWEQELNIGTIYEGVLREILPYAYNRIVSESEINEETDINKPPPEIEIRSTRIKKE